VKSPKRRLTFWISSSAIADGTGVLMIAGL
jgi:hypothetical protein